MISNYFNLKDKTPYMTINLLGLIAIMVIAIVLIMEYGFNILPCKICSYQRISYYIIIILALSNITIKRQSYAKKLIYIYILLLALNAILAFYHAGIEYGYFDNVFNCTAVDGNYESVLQLKNLLTDKISVPCHKIAFKFILSLSGWNMVLSMILIIFALRRNTHIM